MSTAIRIENLSKKYIIGHQRTKHYVTFRDVLMHKIRGLGLSIRHPLSPNLEGIRQEELWALRDINLEIRQGDRVGTDAAGCGGSSSKLIGNTTGQRCHLKRRDMFKQNLVTTLAEGNQHATWGV